MVAPGFSLRWTVRPRSRGSITRWGWIDHVLHGETRFHLVTFSLLEVGRDIFAWNRSDDSVIFYYSLFKRLMMETGAGQNPVRRSKRKRSQEEARKEKKPTGKVVVDFSLVYKRDPSKRNSRGPAGVRDLQETVFTKTQRNVDDKGTVMESRVLEQISWSTEEVEYLIALRSKGDELFGQALRDKKLSRAWEKAACGISRDAKVRKDAKQCQWMWYVLMKEYNNVLEGRQKEDEFPFYIQMQETRKYRTQTHTSGN